MSNLIEIQSATGFKTDKHNYTIIETVRTVDAVRAALAFSAILAADKGIPNEIKTILGDQVVVADDNRAIRFTSRKY